MIVDLNEDGSAALSILGPGPGILFLKADTGSGRELYKTDGTANGTVLVKDICPGECSGLF